MQMQKHGIMHADLMAGEAVNFDSTRCKQLLLLMLFMEINGCLKLNEGIQYTDVLLLQVHTLLNCQVY